MKFIIHANRLLMILAPLLMLLGGYLIWQDYQLARQTNQQEAAYQQALDQHTANNIYYKPEAIIDWLIVRQNPRGFFVNNPDMMFEPSQLNTNTLRTTRYAVVTLSTLNALYKLDKTRIIDWVISNYVPDLQHARFKLDKSVYHEGPYAGFRTYEDEMVGVRPTMDAIIILQTLNALDDPRLDLLRIEHFILAHQNEDGGFWDEYYAHSGQKSCLKCTSFALRALGVIQQHMKRSFDESFKNNVYRFVKSCEDTQSGGYGPRPGKSANDSYNSFRAFISLWWLQSGNSENRQQFVENKMNIDVLVKYLQDIYYQPEYNAFSRYRNSARRTASLKASHLIVWVISYMGRDLGDKKAEFVRYVLANEAKPGEYGGDIYSTYSATGILNKLNVSTQALAAPQRPQILDHRGRSYAPYVLLGLGILVLALSYVCKKAELEALNKALAIRVMRDELTGVYNRVKLEEIYATEALKASRYNTPLSLIMLDVDHFKKINDSHGHLVGDEVLIKLAHSIKKNLREIDIFARWGGEEFAILTPETRLEEAGVIAEKIRLLIEHAEFENVGKITCSFGVAQLDANETLEQLTSRADMALYQAKAGGRNCVMVSQGGAAWP
ncbi:MAG: diguanylate cyclase [Gammaproteobacteria bacterium]